MAAVPVFCFTSLSGKWDDNGMNEVTVRAATMEDIPVMVDIWHQSTADFIAQMPAGFGAPMKVPFDGDEYASSAAWLGKTLADDDHYALVTVVDGVVRGFLGGEIRRTTDDFFHAPYFYINHLYVDRTMRHAGLGRALMDGIERWGKEKGMHALDMEVGDLNVSGIKFYASLGFIPLSRRMARMLDR